MNMCEPLLKEYFELLKVISDFDGRLLLIKGWGVTFGLATLALGFQKRSAGILLVAALSGLCFWTLEATFKGYQMRYYPRMRHIEVVCAQAPQSQLPPQPGPLIDWSWDHAPNQPSAGRIPKEAMVQERATLPGYFERMLLPHVALPHVITVTFGVLLAFLAYRRKLPAIWGEEG